MSFFLISLIFLPYLSTLYTIKLREYISSDENFWYNKNAIFKTSKIKTKIPRKKIIRVRELDLWRTYTYNFKREEKWVLVTKEVYEEVAKNIVIKGTILKDEHLHYDQFAKLRTLAWYRQRNFRIPAHLLEQEREEKR